MKIATDNAKEYLRSRILCMIDVNNELQLEIQLLAEAHIECCPGNYSSSSSSLSSSSSSGSSSSSSSSSSSFSSSSSSVSSSSSSSGYPENYIINEDGTLELDEDGQPAIDES